MDFTLRGVLKGHKGWVTSIALIPGGKDGEKRIISGSRDKTLIIWELNYNGDVATYGLPVRSLEGHSHFVQDISVSSDGEYALSASWDTTIRLWKLATGNTTITFLGHSKDVLAVTFSANNRKILSGSRDKTLKLWNTLGECKHTVDEKQDGHSSWVTSVRCSPDSNNPVVVTSSWDNQVKVFNTENMKLVHNLSKHTGFVNCVAISPDGSLCASGGKDGSINLWGLGEGKHLNTLQTNSPVYCLAFSPSHYWLVAGCENFIKVFDIEKREVLFTITNESHVDFHIHPTVAITKRPACTALTWGANGKALYAGYSDNFIRVWEFSSQKN